MWDIPNRTGSFLTFPKTKVTALRYSPNGLIWRWRSILHFPLSI